MNTDLIIAIVFFIIGLIPAYYFYRKSIKIKEPVYSITSNNLVSDSTSEYQNLKISYNRKRVENLTVSKVLFYNRGAETITQEDIITKNRPRIVPKEGVKILDASILQQNNPSSDFSVSSALLHQNNEVNIWFKYLDKNQGAVYQIVHTGLSSKDLDVVGDVRGVSIIVRITLETRPIPKFFTNFRRNRPVVWITFIPAMLFLFAVLLSNLFYLIYPEETQQVMTSLFSFSPSDANGFLILSSIMLITFAFFSIEMARDFLRRYKVAPKGLEKFDEN